MAKASRVAARTQKTLIEVSDQLDALERRLIKVEALLEVMLTKAQRERLAALLEGSTEFAPEEGEADERSEGA